MNNEDIERIENHIDAAEIRVAGMLVMASGHWAWGLFVFLLPGLVKSLANAKRYWKESAPQHDRNRSMRRLLVLLLLTVPMFGKDYPLTAKVLSDESAGGNVTYVHDAKTYKIVGTTSENDFVRVELQVGGVVYVGEGFNDIPVGQTLPARIKGSHIYVQVGKKERWFKIVGTKVS